MRFPVATRHCMTYKVIILLYLYCLGHLEFRSIRVTLLYVQHMIMIIVLYILRVVHLYTRLHLSVFILLCCVLYTARITKILIMNVDQNVHRYTVEST